MNFLYLFIVAISLIAKIRRTILFLVSWFIVIKIILNKSCFLIRIIEVSTSYIYSWPRYSFFDKEIEKEKERFLFVLFRILLSFFFFLEKGWFLLFLWAGFLCSWVWIWNWGREFWIRMLKKRVQEGFKVVEHFDKWEIFWYYSNYTLRIILQFYCTAFVQKIRKNHCLV